MTVFYHDKAITVDTNAPCGDCSSHAFYEFEEGFAPVLLKSPPSLRVRMVDP
jgi:hypothetical protein